MVKINSVRKTTQLLKIVDEESKKCTSENTAKTQHLTM